MGIIGLEDGVSLVELLIFGFIGVNLLLSGSMLVGVGMKKVAANGVSE